MRKLGWLAIATVVCLLTFASLAVYSTYYYESPGPLPEERTILFKRGMGFREIVDDMAEREIIRRPLLFKIIAVILGDARKFKAGEYHFSAAISPRLIMDMIAEGRVVVHKLIVPEGLTSAQILQILRDETALDGDIVGDIAEGSLLPDTFHFTYGDSRRDLVNRMQEGMRTTLAELWEKRAPDLPFKTPQEAVTLASIVEKETRIAAERRRVAAVYINRLRIGMRLQADPTVMYGIEKNKGPLGRLLVLSDLKYDSPYNTYIYAGLPPGPIGSPGRASLEAALSPLATDELYFVATGDGGHNFSATLEDHGKNVKEYRKKRSEKAAEEKKKNQPTAKAAR